MTDTGTAAPPARRKPGRLQQPGALGQYVSGVVAGLQNGYLKQRPAAIATLAQLRQAVNAEPGTAGLQAIWLPDELIEPELRREDASHPGATPSERALHTAVTLFAIHQQSQRDQRMHAPGTSFATACQWMAAARGSDETVHRRFAAVGTAVDYRELVYHARNLVTQLRAAKIGFDYGAFADDLALFLRREPLPSGLTGAAHVRARWGREYWRAASAPTETAAPAAENPDPSTDQE